MHGPAVVYVREPTLPTHEIGGPTQYPMHPGGLSEVGPVVVPAAPSVDPKPEESRRDKRKCRAKEARVLLMGLRRVNPGPPEKMPV